MAKLCEGCELPSWYVIAKFYGEFRQNSDDAIEFLRDHGVLPRQVFCDHCGRSCNFRLAKHQWYCCHYIKIYKSKKKRKRCNYTSSDYKGTFLEGTHLQPWKILLFVNHWLGKKFDHNTIFRNLNLSTNTSVNWRRYCSQVTQFWLQNQDSIGGEDIVVEIGESPILKRSQERGHKPSYIWAFGGIERHSKKFFVVPLVAPLSEVRDEATYLSLIQRHIKPGSVVVSEAWGSFLTLGHNYIHLVVQNTPTPQEHTLNIDRVWRDLKEWETRRGMQTNFKETFARYLFIYQFQDQRLHRFLCEAARLYPPQCESPWPSSSNTDNTAYLPFSVSDSFSEGPVSD